MTLHLLPAELAIYEQLPKELQIYSVKNEEGTAWETDEQLVARAQYVHDHLDTKTHLGLQHALSKLRSHGIDAITGSDFPKKAISSVLYMIGAIGLTAIIDKALTNAKNAEDLEAVEMCVSVRHTILASNHANLPQTV